MVPSSLKVANSGDTPVLTVHIEKLHHPLFSCNFTFTSADGSSILTPTPVERNHAKGCREVGKGARKHPKAVHIDHRESLPLKPRADEASGGSGVAVGNLLCRSEC